MDIDINIIEAYLKEFGQMIILLIGMPTSNKSNLAKKLESDIEPKFTLININDYFEKNFIDVEVKNINFKLYDHPDNINYSKLFDDINKVKSTGVILYGNSIDTNKIKDIKIDFSYFFDVKPNLLKNNLIKNKKLPFSTSQEEHIDEKINDKLEIYIKDILIPIYNNIKKNIKFNKFYNIKEDTQFIDIYDNLFDYFILLIKKKLDQPIETETETESESKSTETESKSTETESKSTESESSETE